MPLPTRRWFQFRLSTWFVLVAILAWAMLYWPWVVTRYETIPLSARVKQIAGPAGVTLVRTGGLVPVAERRSFDPDLLDPALALAAFVGWKAAWLIVERQRNRPATH